MENRAASVTLYTSPCHYSALQTVHAITSPKLISLSQRQITLFKCRISVFRAVRTWKSESSACNNRAVTLAALLVWIICYCLPATITIHTRRCSHFNASHILNVTARNVSFEFQSTQYICPSWNYVTPCLSHITSNSHSYKRLTTWK